MPIHWAAGAGHAEAVDLLLNHGSPYDVPDDVTHLITHPFFFVFLPCFDFVSGQIRGPTGR